MGAMGMGGAIQNGNPLTKIPPNVQAQRDAVAQQVLDGEGNGQKFNPRLNDTGRGGVAPQMATLSQFPGAGAPTAKSAAATAISMLPAEAQTSINKQWVTHTFQPIMDEGKSAREQLAQIQAMRSIDLTTGVGTELKGKLAALGGALGIPDAEKYAGNIQKFNSLAFDSVNKELRLNPGVQTEGDAQRAVKIFASLDKVGEANRFIMDMKEAASNQRVRAAAFHQDALPIATKTGDLTHVTREWRDIAGSIWADPVMKKWVKK
jgi:hypothetical protein